MKITLYQIIPELDTDRLMFNNFDYMRIAYGNKIPAHLYESVYSGEFDTERLEDIFYIFNQDFPDDYRGRSMSVSDVLEVIKSPTESVFYYCDSVGYKEIEFDKQKAMLQIQNHDFQNTLIIKENLRIFFISNNGLEDHTCSKIVLRRCKFSESQLGYELELFPRFEEKSIKRHFPNKPLFVLTKCLLRLPENLLYEIKDQNGLIIKKSRYLAHSLDILGAVSTWIIQCGFTFENM